MLTAILTTFPEMLWPHRGRFRRQQQVEEDKSGLPDCKDSDRSGEYITDEGETPQWCYPEIREGDHRASGEGEHSLRQIKMYRVH